jgi:ABC-2 type transport system permease protein
VSVGVGVAQTWYMMGRQLRNLLREPIWIVLMLVQPMFWLLLYPLLVRRIVDLPGFEGLDYVDFLAPGIVIMTAYFSGTWAGMGMLQDVHRGVLERFLATPTRRSALVFSHVVRNAVQSALQGLIVLAVALALGATNGGPTGWAVIVTAGAFVAAGFAGISTGIALLTRKEATMIAVANFIGLPLLFFSSILIARALIPGWMQDLSLANPVEWAVRAAREPVLPDTAWDQIGVFLALLFVFAIATGAFATWAFRAYQRSL